MTRILSLIVTLGLLSSACQGAAEDPVVPTPGVEPVVEPVTMVPGVALPIDETAVVTRYDLSMFGAPVGVAVDPDTSQRLVLTDWGSIHELAAEISEEPVWFGAPSGPFVSAFTDLAALGDGQLALTSMSDGFLLDLSTGELQQHFCYEPGWMEPIGEDPVQLSFGVAHDAPAGLLYAQPRTIELGGAGATTENFVSSYDEAGGSDLSWWSIEDLGFAAGGMVVIESGAYTGEARLLLGAGTDLHEFHTGTAELEPVAGLDSLGVTVIGGLALDESAGTLLVADPGSMAVLEVRLSALDLE